MLILMVLSSRECLCVNLVGCRQLGESSFGLLSAVVVDHLRMVLALLGTRGDGFGRMPTLFQKTRRRMPCHRILQMEAVSAVRPRAMLPWPPVVATFRLYKI